MSARRRDLLASLALCAIAAGIFLTGITWGLPSRRVDPFLFGDHPVWSGQQIIELAGDRQSDSKLGADVDANPIARGSRPIVLNETDQQRAQIVRRYRLYSYQPDEMITFMALSTIRQHGGDPKLYQYGGLWIYPVGALIKLFAHPRADQAYYLDHPEEFAKFYVIARLYVVAWGLIGVCAIFWIARRLGADLLVAATATMCAVSMPVVVNMAHEAKPHLPGAVLILLAVIAGTNYVETGRARWWIGAGVLCGAAFGMVLSAIVAFLVLPIMTLARADPWSRKFRVVLASAACGLTTFAITNPYVIIHLFHNREILASNLQNSRAMYHAAPSPEGFLNAIYLLCAGATPLLTGVGGFFAIRSFRSRSAVGWMLTIVSAAVLVQFVLLASGKPGEYARFALLPDIALCIAAVVSVGTRLQHRAPRFVAMMALSGFTGLWCASYLWHFVRDSVPRNTRMIVAGRLASLEKRGARVLATNAEPAPYCLPPVDLFSWKLVLADSMPTDADVFVRTVDLVPRATNDKGPIQYWIGPRLLPTPISWAAKPYEVIHKEK